MGRFLPPDQDAGDANTIGGYQAVHARPAAFEGKDGASYSVEIVVDETGDPKNAYAAYLLFVRWKATDLVAAGHLETEYLTFGPDETSVRSTLGTMRLSEAKQRLDALITKNTPPSRPWYEAMYDDDDES
jgi:hypothetical protein